MPFNPITNTQQFDLRINPTNSVTGKPAPVDGDPIWTSSDESVATVTPRPGTLIADVKGLAKGDYSISCSVDADLGPGIRTLVAQDTGSVTVAEADTLAFVQGPIIEQP